MNNNIKRILQNDADPIIELHVKDLPSLDLILGGGFPKGRIVELYGPESSGKSTMALHILKSAQEAVGDRKVAYIDAENAFDPNYAEKLGIDLSRLFLNQPQTGEEALQITETLCETNKISVIVIDPVPCLIPKAQDDKEIDGTAGMASTARMLAQYLPKIIKAASNSNTVIVFINQIRMKIGVRATPQRLFVPPVGRFSYGAVFNLPNGSTTKMGKAVNAKFKGEILTYDFSKMGVTTHHVTSVICEKNNDQWLYFKVKKHQGSGLCKFLCTPNQAIYTPEGLAIAQDLRPGDKVWKLSEGRSNDSNDFSDFMVGSLLGDGSMRPNGILRWLHGTKQTDYVDWKQGFFDDAVPRIDKLGQHSFEVPVNRHMALKYGEFYRGTKSEVLPKEIHSLLNPRAVAVWYMDDGCLSGSYERWGNGKATISVKSYSKKDVGVLKDVLLVRYGINSNNTSGKFIEVSGEDAERLFVLIAPFVHPSMVRKIPAKFQKPFIDFDKGKWQTCFELEPAEIVSIERQPTDSRKEKMFSMSVDRTHNIFIDGVLCSDGT